MPDSPKPFFWYELLTTDPKAAEEFYKAVVGWEAEAFPGDPAMPPYTVVKAGERGVGGIMEIPENARQGGLPPGWLGYIHTDDVDKTTDEVRKAGGTVHREPADIPGVGRFSVVADPQGAMFQLLAPNGAEQPPIDVGTPGHVGWHELYTTDWKQAFDFYSSRFGWSEDRQFDMGEMGIYEIFAAGGEAVGGMMNKPEQVPFPVWQFYFTVPAIDAAAKAVSDRGGKVLMGPMQVPNGSWIVQCQDPQGAHFALTAPRR